MSSMSDYAKKLEELKGCEDPETFEKSPAGYALRERATLVTLCFHPDPAVRFAIATNPLLRDMFAIMMYNNEETKEIKNALEPRYKKALSKEDQRDLHMNALEDENASLREKIAALMKKKNTKK